MTDLHCHILHGVDDGSDSLDCSVKMGILAANSGVDKICATPHLRVEDPEECLAQISLFKERFPVVRRALSTVGIELYSGAEILCTPDVCEYLRAGLLPTIGNGRYLLCEFLFDDSISYMDDVLGGILRLGYIPVIAHPERYDAVRRDARVLIRWFEYGYIIQLNKGSITGQFGSKTKKCALWALENGLCHVVASDAHGYEMRTPHMTTACEMIDRICGEEYLHVLTKENPDRILRGESVVPA